MVSFLGAPRRAPSLPALLHAKVRTNLAIPRGLTARRYQEEDKETNSNKATTQTSRRGEKYGGHLVSLS